ncbi:endonuclease domain-containing protein [Epidermidibacterium keratini]
MTPALSSIFGGHGVSTGPRVVHIELSHPRATCPVSLMLASMNAVERLMGEQFGVVRAAALLRYLDRSTLRALVRTGQARQVIHGWYANADADMRAITAVRAGGALTCLDALELHGIWVPHGERAVRHVRPGSGARQPRLSISGVRYCEPVGCRPPTARAVDSPIVAMLSATECCSAEEFVAICDSMLHQGFVERDELDQLLSAYPARIRSLVNWCDGRAESGTESLVRFRLARAGVKLRPQVTVVGIGKVDLLIGRRLIIEVDSREYHGGQEPYQRDRRRDRRSAGRSYIVVRLTYADVMFHWDEALEDIMQIIRRREHLRPLPAR